MEPPIIAKRTYISGPMSGLTRDQYTERFLLAEQQLIENGYTNIVNPVRFWVSKPWIHKILGYRLTLLYDLWVLTHCQVIYKIPGWKQSRGAQIESCIAFHFNITVVPKPLREIIDQKITEFIKNKEIDEDKEIEEYLKSKGVEE